MRIKITISYDGTEFCGWQIQPKGNSVQQTVQDAIFKLTGQTVKVTGSGRTDAGVHANGQVAHFDVDGCSIPPNNFAKALNTVLPSAVRVLDSCQVDDCFDARKTAKRKTYTYSLYVSQVEKPLKERFAVRLDHAPDIQLIKNGAKIFIGEHDFKSFNASGSGAKSTVRTIYDIQVDAVGEDLFISVTGNGFLYNMVRTLVGTLLDIGFGNKTVEQVAQTLKDGDRASCGRTYPAKGLTLQTVEY